MIISVILASSSFCSDAGYCHPKQNFFKCGMNLRPYNHEIHLCLKWTTWYWVQPSIFLYPLETVLYVNHVCSALGTLHMHEPMPGTQSPHSTLVKRVTSTNWSEAIEESKFASIITEAMTLASCPQLYEMDPGWPHSGNIALVPNCFECLLCYHKVYDKITASKSSVVQYN